jgi:hypothetical protein
LLAARRDWEQARTAWVRCLPLVGTATAEEATAGRDWEPCAFENDIQPLAWAEEPGHDRLTRAWVAEWRPSED